MNLANCPKLVDVIHLQQLGFHRLGYGPSRPTSVDAKAGALA
jgi:hypothetical protein